jgi:hypothetical protein
MSRILKGDIYKANFGPTEGDRYMVNDGIEKTALSLIGNNTYKFSNYHNRYILSSFTLQEIVLMLTTLREMEGYA